MQYLNPKLAAYVVIPRNLPGTAAAYLGSKFAAIETGADPAETGPFSVPDFTLSEGLSVDRGGRDHWPRVFSAAVAGGGILGGRVVGASDSIGGEPAENPKAPQDVLATMYRHLEIDVSAQYEDYSGRPHPVLSSGKSNDELFV